MLYYSFKNYEEFKEIFGVVEHGNGVKSRKNKILLSLYKNRNVLRNAARPDEEFTNNCLFSYDKDGNVREYYRWHCTRTYSFYNILEATSLTHLRHYCYRVMNMGCKHYELNLNGNTFSSDVFSTDDFKGVCEDGDWNSVRYVNHERDNRVFKMKAGKFFRKLVEECQPLMEILSYEAKIWLCEQFAEEWKAYASQFSEEYTLHIDDNFSDIYDSCMLDGDFKSCMVDKGFHDFYSEAVNAKAAYLTKVGKDGECGSIVARCIIFPEVQVYGTGEVLRLAERQYASDGSDKLKRQLIMALIAAGEIDGYKKIGACCSDSTGFVDIHGNSLPSTDMWIRCEIDDCSISYQDSFKYYDSYNCRAYNKCVHCSYMNLDVTDGGLEDDHSNESWSEYNQEYIPDDESVYVDTRDDNFWYNQTVRARVWNERRCFYEEERCFEEDCIEIDGRYYYAGQCREDPESYNLECCEHCGEYFVCGEGCYSELTDCQYCCEHCMDADERCYKKDNGWIYSQWDDEYYSNAEDVSTIYVWKRQVFPWHEPSHYEKTTISLESLQELIDNEEVTWMHDAYYKDDIGYDGEPVHYAAAERVAA